MDQQLTRPRDGEPKGLFEIGVHHVGFWVDNLDEIAAGARAAGVPIIAEPSEHGADTVTYGEPPGGRVRGMFVRDPDDNVVQIRRTGGLKRRRPRFLLASLDHHVTFTA